MTGLGWSLAQRFDFSPSLVKLAITLRIRNYRTPAAFPLTPTLSLQTKIRLEGEGDGGWRPRQWHPGARGTRHRCFLSGEAARACDRAMHH